MKKPQELSVSLSKNMDLKSLVSCIKKDMLKNINLILKSFVSLHESKAVWQVLRGHENQVLKQ